MKDREDLSWKCVMLNFRMRRLFLVASHTLAAICSTLDNLLILKMVSFSLYVKNQPDLNNHLSKLNRPTSACSSVMLEWVKKLSRALKIEDI